MSAVILLTLEDARTVLREELSGLLGAHEPDSNSHSGNDKYLSSNDVQEILCISKATLARWRHNQKIRFSRIGGKLLYRREDIENLVESSVVAGGAG